MLRNEFYGRWLVHSITKSNDHIRLIVQFLHTKLNLDDVPLPVDDAVEYLKQQEKFNRSQNQVVETSGKVIFNDCLTIDDVILAEKNLPLQQYDAFILFSDKDIGFATEMIEQVESFGFKVNVSNGMHASNNEIIHNAGLLLLFSVVRQRTGLFSWFEFRTWRDSTFANWTVRSIDCYPFTRFCVQFPQRLHIQFSTVIRYCSTYSQNHSMFIQGMWWTARNFSTYSSTQVPEIESNFQFLGKIKSFTANDTRRTDSTSMSSVSRKDV